MAAETIIPVRPLHRIRRGTGLLWASLMALSAFVSCSKDRITPLPESEIEKYDYYQYGVGRLEITTDNQTPVSSKENYVACEVNLKGNGFFPDHLYLRGKIRGRGNSTWAWYPKKPYRIKLDQSSPMMGMEKGKDWVLLADFRDITHLMNNVAFTLAHELELPHANHSRYVNLILNEQDMGLYMLTEQIEEGKRRVNVDATRGILLALDLNDGPGESPQATDNFWSSGFQMACAVKFPRDPDAATVQRVKSAFAELEDVINRRDWDGIQSLLDVDTMIKYILIQEIIGNGEVDNNPSMRSGYIHRYDDKSKWVMGPMWDADAGFGYDGSDMFNRQGRCHTYFIHNEALVFGTEPYRHIGAMNGTASDLFCKLWGIPAFVYRLQKLWNERHEALLSAVLEQIKQSENAIMYKAAADIKIWNIQGFTHTGGVNGLKTYLRNRFSYLDGIIKAYPVKAY